MEKRRRRRRRRRRGTAQAQRITHPLLKVAEGMTQIRVEEREGIYKPRARAAWVILPG